MNNKLIFANEERIANEEHLNALGEEINSWGYENADDDDMDAIGDDLNADGYEYAAAKKPAARKPVAPSLPIVIIVENTTTNDDYQVELFDAINRSFASNVALSSTGTCTLKSGNGNVSYSEIIRSLLSETVIFGTLRVSTEYAPSASLYSAACSQSLTHVIRNSSGQSKTSPVITPANLFQQQENIREAKTPMAVNTWTSIKTTILAGCRVRFEFYPREISNTMTSMQGRTVKTASPRLNELQADKWKR